MQTNLATFSAANQAAVKATKYSADFATYKPDGTTKCSAYLSTQSTAIATAFFTTKRTAIVPALFASIPATFFTTIPAAVEAALESADSHPNIKAHN